MEIKPIPNIENCREIGLISRPHGNEGNVLISTKNISNEDFKSFDYVFFKLQERLVPFFIESVTLKSNSVFVKFEDITSMSKAEMYCGTRVYIEQDEEETSEDGQLQELEGFYVVDAKTQKRIGKIQEVVEYSINVVLDIQTPEGKSVLVPFADELLKDCNESTKTIVLEIPDGILEA